MKIKANSVFKETRLKKGFSIVDLAEAVGMTKQALGQVERGDNGIGPSNSQKILKVLNVEFDDVFEITD